MEAVRKMIEGVLALKPGADALEFARCWTSWGQLKVSQPELRALFAADQKDGETA